MIRIIARRSTMILAGFIGLVLSVLGVWLVLFAGPVVWSFKESSPSGEPDFVIFNPFRERGSEDEAAKALALLQSGDCGEATFKLRSGESFAGICAIESGYGLEDWVLSNRRDGAKGVRLFYRVKRMSSPSYNEGIWIDVERAADGWAVTDIEAVY